MTQPAVLIRLRPLGPWRYGPGDGAPDRVDALYRSDRVFSAVTIAAQTLGFLEDWLAATVRAKTPVVTFTSLFPYQGETLFATPPATAWPPPASQITAPNPSFLNKIRWNSVILAPLPVIDSLLTGQSIPADQWVADSGTGCLLRRDRPGSVPFRFAVRSGVAVDRLGSGAVHLHSSACVEFEADAGLWTVARFADQAAASLWEERVKSCFRWLADSGFGGRRSSGWGKADTPEFRSGAWPGVILPKLARASRNDNGADASEPSLYWLLSLYSPASTDAVDWSGGDYRIAIRGGRVADGIASGARKKDMRMVTEGSVISLRREPVGSAIDVAPANCAHPVYRSGLAVSLKLPVIREAADLMAVEVPTDEPSETACSEKAREESPILDLQEPEPQEQESEPEKHEHEPDEQNLQPERQASELEEQAEPHAPEAALPSEEPLDEL